MSNAPTGRADTTWITKAEAASIVPGLTPARLDWMRREVRYVPRFLAPPARVLSDGEVIYDELLFRRWLESRVSQDWVSGPGYANPRVVTADRYYAYQDADLGRLRRRTYINETKLREVMPDVPLWRIRELRFRGAGPRFLKPTAKLVVYIEEEAIDWYTNVSDFSDPEPRIDHLKTAPPYTPAPTL